MSNPFGRGNRLRHAMPLIGAALVVAALVVVGVRLVGSTSDAIPSSIPPSTTSATPVATQQESIRWGLIGNDGNHLAQERAAGITTKLLALAWSAYEPSDDHFDGGYVAQKRAELDALHRAGFDVILDLGVQYSPDWLLTYPDAYYLDQFGDRYDDPCSGCELPNFVFNPTLRSLQGRYIARVFSDLGRDFAGVRVGGGHYGELGYPTQSYGGHQSTYWAFDVNAGANNPVPGWKPGNLSLHGEAAEFLNWYLNSLVSYETWQIATVRAAYPGRIMLLLPSWGIRPGETDEAIAGNLGGSSPAEKTGEIQRGYDFARQVYAITDPNVYLDTTWLDADSSHDSGNDVGLWSPVHYLASLSATGSLHLPLYGENATGCTKERLALAASQARRYGLQGFLVYNEEELLSGRYASLADYAAIIRSGG